MYGVVESLLLTRGPPDLSAQACMFFMWNNTRFLLFFLFYVTLPRIHRQFSGDNQLVHYTFQIKTCVMSKILKLRQRQINMSDYIPATFTIPNLLCKIVKLTPANSGTLKRTLEKSSKINSKLTPVTWKVSKTYSGWVLQTQHSTPNLIPLAPPTLLANHI